jgi:hypothetical protein
MANEVATQTPVEAATMEQVIIGGDLAQLAPNERVAYYRRVCESVGLNPFTKPFQYIKLNGRLVLYTTKDATEQLRKLHGVSITGLSATFDQAAGVYVVVATASDREGRTDSATGAVPMPDSLQGEARANAIMKAETKAKRRVTLSISGLAFLDDSERESIPGAVVVDIEEDNAALATAGEGFMGKPEVDGPGPVVFDHGKPEGGEDLGWDESDQAGGASSQPELK